jgi:hypothetical protein
MIRHWALLSSASWYPRWTYRTIIGSIGPSIEITATGPEEGRFEYSGDVFAGARKPAASFLAVFGAEIRDWIGVGVHGTGAAVVASAEVLIFSAAIACADVRTNPAIRDGMIRYNAFLILPPL